MEQSWSGHNAMNLNHLRHCARCGVPYDWRRSMSSWLKMTYCSSLCERADMGFTLDGLMSASRAQPDVFSLFRAAAAAA
jgi:hypothetical protein